MISGKAQEGTDGPDRRVFRITRRGRDRLRPVSTNDRRSWRRTRPVPGSLSGFAHLLSAAESRRTVDARELAVRDLLDAIRTERARTSDDRGGGRMVANAMLDRQETLARAELAWLARFRTRELVEGARG